jgi:nicotinate dehydrogenase subunit B
MTHSVMLQRRAMLQGAGALVIGFTLAQRASATPFTLPIGPYGAPEDEVDSWIAIDSDGITTLYTGCCELGTGSSTGLLQIMAEELDVTFASTRLEGPDTSRVVDQYVSSGSRTIAYHAVPIRRAAAEARAALVTKAAEKLGVAASEIETRDGIASVRGAPDKKVSYGELIGGQPFALKVSGKVAPKKPADYRLVGTSVPRIDLPGKVFGTFTYMHDMKVPGMLHARMLRPPANGASVVSIDENSVAHIKGFVKVVRQADLVGVICEREEQAIAAAAALKITWTDWSGLPPQSALYERIRALPEFVGGYPKDAPGGVLSKIGDVDSAISGAARTVTATYMAPYNHHGSIGPSCAIAHVTPDGTTIWSATQTPFGLREATAKFLGVGNDKVRLIYVEGSGCYGQNGADDVVIDAVVLSRAVGRPVRVQWSRADENTWEALKAARVTEARAGLDAAGNIVGWDVRTFGLSGYSRPEYHEPKHGGEPGSLVTAQLAGWEKPGLEEGFSGAAGNFLPVYDLPAQRVVFTYLGPDSHRKGPLRLRVGSMRGVGSPDNIYVCETFMDELAAAAGADPVEFRMRHLKSERHMAVLKAAVAAYGWQPRDKMPRAEGDVVRGRGIALLGTDNIFFKTHDTIVAGILEVEVNRSTGVVRCTRAVIAQDCGLVVNPDGIRNQLEGGVIQNLSRGLMEEATFDDKTITSVDWASYPIIRFPMVPDKVEVVLVNRPDLPAMRVGEPASESVWPALSNAIFDATGTRLRQMPFTPKRLLAAMAGTSKAG